MCSPAPAPASQTQTTTTELPEWARGYAKDTLAKGQALTDINQNPYQTYNQPRIAGFSPLQEQAQAGAGRLGPTQQTAQASDFAAQAGLGALNMPQYQAGQFSGGRFGTGAAQAYMNPYIQAALDPQMALLQKQQGQQAAQMAGQATQAGAFGGSRYGIAKAQQNLNNQLAMQNLVGQGYNTAYQQAQNQFNQDMARRMQAQQLGEQSRQFGANLGMQGLQTGLQAAGTLGNLGQQQFGQQQQAIDAQSKMGAQQQALRQQGLDVAYQDFLNQQNYPYKQLGFMSDLVRGLPLGQQSTAQMYQGAPTAMQSLTGLGLGAYGLSKLGGAKEGGLMQSFAEGGMTIGEKFNDPEAMLSEMDKLTDAQLQAIIKSPATPAEAEAAKRELAMRASERGGLAGAFNQMPQQQQDAMVRAAGGGIIAFSGDDDENDPQTGQQVSLNSRIADPELQRQLNKRGLSIADYLMNPSAYKAPTAAERMKYMKDYTSEMTEAAGESPTAGLRQYLQEQRDNLSKEREEGKGLAALQAIPHVLQPGGFIRGAGAGLASFGGAMGELSKAQRTAKNQFAQMEFNLADADRKERMGLHRDARAAFDESEKNKLAGIKADREAKAAAGNIVGKLAQANRVTGSTGAGGSPKEFVVGPEIYLARIKEEHPEWTPAQQRAAAFDQYQKGKSAGFAGAEIRTNAQIDAIMSRSDIDAGAKAEKAKIFDAEWQKATEAGDAAGQKRAVDRLTREAQGRSSSRPSAGLGGTPTGMPPPPPGFNPVRQ